MSAVPGNRGIGSPAWLEWLPVAAGLLVLYVPTLYGVATWIWPQDEHAHGPIIAALVVWLAYQRRASWLAPSFQRAPVAGFGILVLGLLVYVVGRSQSVALFEIGALIPILAGTLLSMRGWSALRSAWFALFFIVFMLPLPGIFVDALTGPLKQHVSEITVAFLHAVGYPVARNGVVITIGQYQLLVADACSGLHSMFSLSALGALFMYLTGRTSVLHNAAMLVAILPIAFAANVVRVLALILITYHFGDAAGQGFLHGAAGIVLMLAALAILLLLDAVLARLFRPQARHKDA
jgi:exosortase B